jgi:hypothetical protein
MLKIKIAAQKGLTESRSLPKILHTLIGGRESIDKLAILTAENPEAKQLSARENIMRNKELELVLRTNNLGFRKLRGKFGNKENSYLVMGIDRDKALDLGKRFSQEAIIWAAKQPGDAGFMFEYITCADGVTQDRKAVVLHGQDVQDRDDFYSQEPKGGEKAGKFLIPFFDSTFDLA